MFYPRFTKVVINHFMSQDQSIPRRNKVDWHMANDDPILDTMRSSSAIPKPKYVHQTTKEKTVQELKASSGKRIKSAAKVTKSGKKKQPAQGLETLSEIALGSGADEGTGVKPGVPDVPTYGSDDEQISWKSSEEEDDDEVAVNDDDDDNDDDNDNVDNQDDEGKEYNDEEDK
ncbi:hypothetical protein Tco_0002801 [Tanacetum coccineum]